MKFIKILFIISTLFTISYTLNLKEKYPNYEYIFKQFDIPLDYIDNSDFVNFVQTNEEKYRNFYKNSLKRGKAYIPMFKELLLSKGLSHLFIYMSMTESGFQTYAKSSKQAVGLWQFMSATAKRFDLQVNSQRDDRYDPIASTEAASRYIRMLYSMFGKWYLVMMAYNCGEGRLQKAIERAGSDDFEKLMSEKEKFIPKETRRYLMKILLLSMMGEKIRVAKDKTSKAIKETIAPSAETLVNIYGGITLDRVAQIIDENPGVLYRLNPQVRGGVIPKSVSITQIYIPTNKVARFRALYHPPTLQEIFKQRGYKRLITHIVKKGESLKDISKEYRVTELDIIVVNELKSDRLKAGSLLMIPITEKAYSRILDKMIIGR